MDLGLTDKVAVITGGSVGIGLAVAHGLAAEGGVVAIAARDGARASERAREIEAAHGTRALAVGADVATAEGCAQLIATVERELGGCDILINNAGSGRNETILEAPNEKWEHYLGLHVMAGGRPFRGGGALFGGRGGGGGP